MRRLFAAGALIAILVAASPASATTTPFAPPSWLLKAEQSLLARTFGNAKPARVYYMPYPKKIAVVFEFSRVVICRLCSSPSTGSEPRGRVIRVSFDRRTHELGGAADGWAMRFCEVRGDEPPKSVCLRR